MPGDVLGLRLQFMEDLASPQTTGLRQLRDNYSEYIPPSMRLLPVDELYNIGRSW